MKKILISLFSILVLCMGAFISGCGEGDLVSAIMLESSSFANEDKNLIEMDITTEENPSVKIKATIDNQEEGRISVVNSSNNVSVSYEYNASLNTNNIVVTALHEGTAELIVKAMSGKVEEKKITIDVFSHITGLEQKTDDQNGKKTQYVVMDENIKLTAEKYLDVTARETCNRKDIVWSTIDTYGNSLSIENNVLRLDSTYFKNYQLAKGEEINQIVVQAQSKYKADVVTEVTLDVLKGVEEVNVEAAYTKSGVKFDPFRVNELVRSSGDDHSTLYYFVDVKTSMDIEWVELTDDVLFEKFNIPHKTFDITKDGENFDEANGVRSYIFKVVYDNNGIYDDNNFSPMLHDFVFSFAYLDYDYTYSTEKIQVNLIDVVKDIKITNDSNEELEDKTVDVYNTYADGRGYFFNVTLTPPRAINTNYYLKLRVARDVVERIPSFNYAEYIQIYTENGANIGFEPESQDDNYVYYISTLDARARTFANGTRIYVVGRTIDVLTANAFSLCFYSDAKTDIKGIVNLNLVYAPSDNFVIESDDLSTKIESSRIGNSKTITLTSANLASINVKDLELVYDKNSNYIVTNLAKTLDRITFDVVVNKVGINDSFNILLRHKNGFKADKTINIEFFKALTSASVSLLQANSNNIAHYGYGEQSFGGGVNNSLNELIVSFGSSVELSFSHDAANSLKDNIQIYFYINGMNGVQEKDIEFATVQEELDTFFDALKNGNNINSQQQAGFIEYITSLGTLRFLTKETSFSGYVVVVFSGYDENHNETKIYRIIDVESYVPVSMLSATSTLIEVIASDSVSADDAYALSNKSVEIGYRNDSNEISYPNLEKVGNKPYFSIYSATAGKTNLSADGKQFISDDGSYIWNLDSRSLYYNGRLIYSISNVETTGRKMTLSLKAETTSDFIEFVDTLVVEYNSFASTYRLSIDVKISNADRVENVIWENKTDDGTIYILLSSDGLVGENNKFTIITTVTDAYNTNLRYYYAPVGGQSNIIKFEDYGKYKEVVVNTAAEKGGYGYVYILPADSVKTNDKIPYSYYDEDGIQQTDYTDLQSLNSQKSGTNITWFDYLYENAFYISNKGEIIRFSDIIIRINLIVADGLSEETALRIYTADEVKNITYINHYVLMSDIEITLESSLFTEVLPFSGSLRGNTGNEIITMKDSMPIFASIGKNGVVKNLVFNGTVLCPGLQNVGFVAVQNAGLIDNVTIDVYQTESGYVSSKIGAKASVSHAGFVGGIVGENFGNGKISNSQVKGLTIFNTQYAGGIAGINSGVIENCCVEMYRFTTGVNTFTADEYVGGFVGLNRSNSSQINGSYIYDYTLTAETNPALVASNGVGAFIGRHETTQSITTSKISNSFAYIGVQKAISTGSVTLTDCYIGYYDADDNYISSETRNNEELWIDADEDGFKSYVNKGESHLKFYQADFVNVNDLVIKDDSDRFVKVNENSMILYLYEISSQDLLTTVEELALKKKNTYSLQELFGLTEEMSNCVVVSSSNLFKITTNLNTLEVKETGNVKISVISKQDFSITKEYDVEIIHIIAEFKALYNGIETTGIEVQEGRSAHIDFTTLSDTYLNSAEKFDLILDDIVVLSDDNEIKVGEHTYAVYNVENSVGMINVFAGAKNAIKTSFIVKSYISLPALSAKVGINDALKEKYFKELSITPYEGTNNIGVDYSSVTIYPSINSQFNVTLLTDSSTDALYISMEHNKATMSLSKKDGADFVKVPSNVIRETGEYVFSYGEVDDRINIKVSRSAYDSEKNRFIYQINLSICEDYKSSIASAERYSLIFNSANDKEGLLTKEVGLILESQEIDNIDIVNYKMGEIRNNAGQYLYSHNNVSMSLMAPGASSIFEATIDPKFSYYEYLTLTYVPQNAGLLSLSVLNKQKDGRYTVNATSNVTNIAYGLKYEPEDKTASYAFKIYVAANIASDCAFPITISFYGYDEDGAPVKLESRTYTLYVTCIRQPEVLVNGSEFTKIAKASSAPVEITVDSDQEIESLTLQGAELKDIALSFQSITDNGNGTKTYNYRLITKVTSTVNSSPDNERGVGQFEIRATVSRVLNGIRETKSMSAYVALVEFDIASVSIYGAEYRESQKLNVFTAYENVVKNFDFNYVFEPESYGINLTEEERNIVYGEYGVDADGKPVLLKEGINHRKEAFINQGYYTDNNSYWINYEYDAYAETEEDKWTPISLMNQLYIVGSNNREQRITWSKVSEEEYSYIHYEGSYAKFKLVYNVDEKQFYITGNSTTGAPIKLRLKYTTHLASMGTNIYWESNYDFAIEVKAYTDEDSPDAINNAKQFLAIEEQGEAKPYILMNDIVLEDYKPFDTSKIMSLDGNGHTIHINSFDHSLQTDVLNLSLFTNVTEGTTLKNVRVNWYNGGQINVNTNEDDGFTKIHVAGLAITNSGIIYNCEVVSFYDETNNTQLKTNDQGLCVTYTRNGVPYYIDGDTRVECVISGFVEENAGNITNSRVGGETLKVITSETTGKAYYKDIDLDTFTITGGGEVNGFVSKNSKNIASSKVTNVQITNTSTYNQVETAGFVNANSGSISSSYVEGKDDGTGAYCFLTTSITSIGRIAGFVVNNNSGSTIENCMTNIVISTTSLFGSGFVYKNEGEIKYAFSASQVEQSSYTQMGFSGLDTNGNLVSENGTISFSYYYDMKYTGNNNLEDVIDTGAQLIDLSRSNNAGLYYGFSFATGDNAEEMLDKADGIWYIRDDGKIGIIAPDVVSHSVRYIAGQNKNNTFLYYYSDMVNNDVKSPNYGNRFSTKYGSKNNPIIIETAKDFDEAMGNSKSTNIQEFYNESEIFGSYRLVDNIDFGELEKNESGNVSVASTSKILTTKDSITNPGAGQIDGNGFKIDNISISLKDKSITGGSHSFGLFARLENGAKILNLDLGLINVTADDTYVVGGLVGVLHNSTIVNVHADQVYNVNENTTLETSGDGVSAQNIAGGLVGVAFGSSTVKDVTIVNSIAQVSFYDSSRQNNDYYLKNMNLISIRTNLLTDAKNLTYFNEFSIAGGIVGYADVFNDDQRTQMIYQHSANKIKNYRLKNLLVDRTVNVRGEVVGGLIGYTSPTSDIENAKLRLAVEEETSNTVSKILSYNAYAGGIVGLGYGYFFRVTTEYDAKTQAQIEASYPAYYSGDTNGDDFARGLEDIFYSTYTGTTTYNYQTKVIGGIIGVMINGEIDNSYSKINVIAKEESKVIAGGVIGRVCGDGTTFSFVVNSDATQTTAASVRLIEVYATGDVRGGYFVDKESGDEEGFGGGIVGILDRNSILALESVNAVNAFSYENVVIKTSGEGANEVKEGNMTSVGVYAIVGGLEQNRGIIRIIYPPMYDANGEQTGTISIKSIGHYPYIKNAAGEKITISPYPGVLRIESVPSSVEASVPTFEIISVSEFSDVIGGYNSVLSAFLVGKHWNPTRWKHTSKAIFPEIRYSTSNSFLFLDCNNIDLVTSQMQNNNIDVYVRGLTDEGTYDDVDLSGKTIIGFGGKLIGPEGWLDEEEINEGKLARKKGGEFVGIKLQEALFTNVSAGFAVQDLKIYYGDETTDKQTTTTGSAFINGSATGISLTDLDIKIINTEFTINAQNGYAGFLVTNVKSSIIQNVLFDFTKSSVKVVGETSTIELNVGLIAGHLEITDGNNLITGNTVNMTDPDGYALQVEIPSGGANNANVGVLFGKVTTPSEALNLELRTSNFYAEKLLQVKSDKIVSTLNVGGQVGYFKLQQLFANARTGIAEEETSKINIIGKYDIVNFGGLVGKTELMTMFTYDYSGSTEASISNNTLVLSDGTTDTEIASLYAGGVFGSLGSVANDINLVASGNQAEQNLTAKFELGNYNNGVQKRVVISAGNIGGILGQTESSVNISGLGVTMNVGQYISDEVNVETSFQGLNANVAGVVGQSSKTLTINNVKTSGTINAFNNGYYVSGIVALNSGKLYIGTGPSVDATGVFESADIKISSGLVQSSINILTSAPVVGGIVSYVDAIGSVDDKKTCKTMIQNAFYDGTIQLFGSTNNGSELTFTVGGIVGQVEATQNGDADGLVSVTKSAFGGYIIASGLDDSYYENTTNQRINNMTGMKFAVGGIVGRIDNGENPVGSYYNISNNASYGDVIVEYSGTIFSKMNTYTFGGIVGVARGTTIKDNVSLMTNNNQGKATNSSVNPICGDSSGCDFGTHAANANYYSSSVTLCTDSNATDIGYFHSYADARNGYGVNTLKAASVSTEFVVDTDSGIDKIKDCLQTAIGNNYTVYEASLKEGSKLKPYQLDSDGVYDAKTPVIYFVPIDGAVAQIDIRATETIKGEAYVDADANRYGFSVAVIGEGKTVTIHGEEENGAIKNRVVENSYSIFDEMEQNDIVSGLIVSYNDSFDNKKTGALYAGGIAGKMTGGIIYASGIYGKLSAGGENVKYVGGLVGEMQAGRIDESYSALHVIYRGIGKDEDTEKARGTVAGIANITGVHNAYISNSFSTGVVETYISANASAFTSSAVDSGFEVKVDNCYTIAQTKIKDHTVVEVVGDSANFGGDATYTNCYYDEDATYAATGGTEMASGETLAYDYKQSNIADIKNINKNESGDPVESVENWKWSYNETDGYFNYGYPTRNFGFLKRPTVVTETVGEDTTTYHLIPNAEKLAQVVSIVSNLEFDYRLEYDIDLAETISYKTGTKALIDNTYKTIFDGNGKTIDNLKGGYLGLFASVDGATIKDLRITNVNIAVPNNTTHVGAVASVCKNSEITNVMTSGHITGTATGDVGGLFAQVEGTNETTFTNCKNYIKINVTANEKSIGGLVGYIEPKVTFNNCTNYGPIQVEGSGSNVGGLVGTLNASDSSFSQCGNTNSVLHGYTTETDGTYHAAGIIGWINAGVSGIKIEQCYNTAMIKAGNKSVTNTTSSNIIKSVASGIVNCGDGVSFTKLTDCLNQGMIEALSSIEDATTGYSWEAGNKLKITYNEGDLVRVSANAIAYNKDCTNYVNTGTIFNNGLFGSKVVGQSEGQEVKFKINGKNYDFDGKTSEFTVSGATISGTYSKTSAVWQVGSTSGASIYISKVDDLGSPVCFYVTVPRTIYYHNGEKTIITTREQEIYNYYNSHIEEKGNGSYYEQAINGYDSKPSSDKRTVVKEDGTTEDVNIWADDVLSFMTETDTQSKLVWTTIAGSNYNLAHDTNTFKGAVELQAATSEIKLSGDSTYINGQKLQDLLNADYDFSVTAVSYSGGIAGLTIDNETATVDKLDENGDGESDTLSIKIFYTYEISSGETKTVNFNYTIEATKREETVSATMGESDVAIKDGKFTIYLDKLTYVGATNETDYKQLGLKDGTTYEVSVFESDGTRVGGANKTYTMTYDATNGTLIPLSGDVDAALKANDCLAWVGRTISLNANQNASIDQEMTYIGMLSKADGVSADQSKSGTIVGKHDVSGNKELTLGDGAVIDKEFSTTLSNTQSEAKSVNIEVDSKYTTTKTSINDNAAEYLVASATYTASAVNSSDNLFKYIAHYGNLNIVSTENKTTRTASSSETNVVDGGTTLISFGTHTFAYIAGVLYYGDDNTGIEISSGNTYSGLDGTGNQYEVTYSVDAATDTIQVTMEWQEIVNYTHTYTYTLQKVSFERLDNASVANKTASVEIKDEKNLVYGQITATYKYDKATSSIIADKTPTDTAMAKSSFTVNYPLTYTLESVTFNKTAGDLSSYSQDFSAGSDSYNDYKVTKYLKDINYNSYSVESNKIKVKFNRTWTIYAADNTVIVKTTPKSATKADVAGVSGTHFVVPTVGANFTIAETVKYKYQQTEATIGSVTSNNSADISQAIALTLDQSAVVSDKVTITYTNNYYLNNYKVVVTDTARSSLQTILEKTNRTAASKNTDVSISVYTNASNGDVTIYDGDMVATTINTGVNYKYVNLAGTGSSEYATKANVTYVESKTANKEEAEPLATFTGVSGSASGAYTDGEYTMTITISGENSIVEISHSVDGQIYKTDTSDFENKIGTDKYQLLIDETNDSIFKLFEISSGEGIYDYNKELKIITSTSKITYEYEESMYYGRLKIKKMTSSGVLKSEAWYIWQLNVNNNEVKIFAYDGTCYIGNEGKVTVDDAKLSYSIYEETHNIVFMISSGNVEIENKYLFDSSNRGLYIGFYSINATPYTWAFNPQTHKIYNDGEDAGHYITNVTMDDGVATATIKSFDSEKLSYVTKTEKAQYLKNIQNLLFVQNTSSGINNLASTGYKLTLEGLSFTPDENPYTSSAIVVKGLLDESGNEIIIDEKPVFEFTDHTSNAEKGFINNVIVTNKNTGSTNTTEQCNIGIVTQGKLTFKPIGNETVFDIEVQYNEYKETSHQKESVVVTSSSYIEEKNGTRTYLLSEAEIEQAGIVMQKDIELGSSNFAGLQASLSGNGYYLNYYLQDKDFISSNSQMVKDINIGGTIYLTNKFAEGSTDRRYVGLLISNAGNAVSEVSTYGSIATKAYTDSVTIGRDEKTLEINKDETTLYKGLTASGVVGTTISSLNLIKSYVNFSSFYDLYGQEKKEITDPDSGETIEVPNYDIYTKFAGIVGKSSGAVENLENQGTIIGYDGANGEDGLDSNEVVEGDKNPTAGSNGRNGQSVATIGYSDDTANPYIGDSEDKDSASKGGYAGYGGKGGDGDGGIDKTSSSTDIIYGKGKLIKDGDGITGSEAKKGKSGCDAISLNTDYIAPAGKDNNNAVDGSVGWNGLNLEMHIETEIHARYNVVVFVPWGERDYEKNVTILNNKNEAVTYKMGAWFSDTDYMKLAVDHANKDIKILYKYNVDLSDYYYSYYQSCEDSNMICYSSLFYEEHQFTFAYDWEHWQLNDLKIYVCDSLIGVNAIEYEAKGRINKTMSYTSGWFESAFAQNYTSTYAYDSSKTINKTADNKKVMYVTQATKIV